MYYKCIYVHSIFLLMHPDSTQANGQYEDVSDHTTGAPAQLSCDLTEPHSPVSS